MGTDRDRRRHRALRRSPTAAAQRFVEVIDLWRRQGDTRHLLTALRNLPVLLERLDHLAAIVELDAALEHLAAIPTWGEEAERYAAVRDRARAALASDDVERARTAGRGRSLDDAARAARELLAG